MYYFNVFIRLKCTWSLGKSHVKRTLLARYSQPVRNYLKWISSYSINPELARCSAHLYECYKDGVRCTRCAAIRTRYRTRTTTGTIPRHRVQPRRGPRWRARCQQPRASWRRTEFDLTVRHYRSLTFLCPISSPRLNWARNYRVLDVILSYRVYQACEWRSAYIGTRHTAIVLSCIYLARFPGIWRRKNTEKYPANNKREGENYLAFIGKDRVIIGTETKGRIWNFQTDIRD